MLSYSFHPDGVHFTEGLTKFDPVLFTQVINEYEQYVASIPVAKHEELPNESSTYPLKDIWLVRDNIVIRNARDTWLFTKFLPIQDLTSYPGPDGFTIYVGKDLRWDISDWELAVDSYIKNIMPYMR